MGSRVRLTLFSLDEANRTVDAIRPTVVRIASHRVALDRIEREIQVLSLVTAGAPAGNPDVRALAEALERRRHLAESLRRGVDEIQRQGPLVKDVRRGLVDFYSVSGDRLIFLCWHLGEPHIGHWHSLEGGYSAREPIAQDDAE